MSEQKAPQQAAQQAPQQTAQQANPQQADPQQAQAAVTALTQGLQNVSIQGGHGGGHGGNGPTKFVSNQFASVKRAPRRQGFQAAEDTGPTALDLEYLYNSKVSTRGSKIYSSAKTWEDIFGNNEPILNGISALGWTRPSGIQGEALPQIIVPGSDGKFRNLKAQAHLGSGKTGCFVLAMLSRIDFKLNKPQAVCVCPTRELALQEADVMDELGKFCGLRVCRAVKPCSGQPDPTNIITDHIVVGTPGSIRYRQKKKHLIGSSVKVLVIDEADHVLKKGNLSVQTKGIKKSLNRDVQVLLFSATFPKSINKSIVDFLGRSNQNIQINVQQSDMKIQNVNHFYINCSKRTKMENLQDIYDVASGVPGCQSIIFCNRKAHARAIYQKLTEDDFAVTHLTGDCSNEERDATMKEFRDRKSNVLITSDVLAHGIDVPAVKMVVNFDLPYHYDRNEPDTECYIHRMGRAGRFARKGVGINLLETKQQLNDLNRIASKFCLDVSKLPSNDYDALEAKINQCLLGPTEESKEKAQ